MKIALCFYGQPRFLDNPNPYSSHIGSIYTQGNVDVFAHFWVTSKVFPASDWSEKYDHYTLPNTPSIIIEQYKPRKFQFEDSRMFGGDTSRVHGLPYFSENNFSNLQSHLYSLERSLFLLQEYVKETDEVYDFVVVSRYDNIIHTFPDLKTLVRGRFYKGNHYNHFVDLIYILDYKLVEGLKAYQNFEDLSGRVNLFTAEEYKLQNCIKYFDYTNIIPIDLVAGIVRSREDNHGQT